MIYSKVVKRIIDFVLALIGSLALSWLFILIALIVAADDPGNPFFSQKRVAKGKGTFRLYKFRTMRRSAPHDVPTHLLDDPKRYITRVGKFLRRTSLDELPQLFNILKGDISIVGPRPALWNQDDLIAERDKYGANDVKPGLTGWAQINGRDTLEIPQKAKLDGEYVKALNKGGIRAFLFDCKCFFGTFFSVLRSDGVVEGGTGAGSGNGGKK